MNVIKNIFTKEIIFRLTINVLDSADCNSAKKAA